MTTITKEITQTVRASINQRRYFENMGQAYASSFSIIGEVMQNARRAGASKVEFVADFEKQSLEVIDDGCGIEDFQNLIELATSGWQSEQVQLSEKPFGMGLFSLFYACKQVSIRSRGQILNASLDDIVSARELSVTRDIDPVTKGTRIMLTGLNEGLMTLQSCYREDSATDESRWKMYVEINQRAAGFDIPVVLKGKEVDQPYARRNLTGHVTSVGWVCLGGIHKSGDIGIGRNATLYFLQGLPIENRNTGYRDRCNNIVHLDSERFIALMPDRANLQDGDTQLKSVEAGFCAGHFVTP